MTVLYVSSAGTGSDDGTSPTHTGGTTGPWTLAQALAASPPAGAEVRVMADGVYTLATTGTVAWANGTSNGNIVLTGANASGVVDGTRPTIQASASGITLVSSSSSHLMLKNLILDGNNLTGVTGINYTPSYGRIRQIKAVNCKNIGIVLFGGNTVWGDRLEAYNCVTGFSLGSTRAYYAAARNCVTGFMLNVGSSIHRWVSVGNSGAGVDLNSVGYQAHDGVSYGNSGAGVNITGNAGFGTFLAGVVSYGNTGDGFATDQVQGGAYLFRCAGGGNSGAAGNYTAGNLPNVEGFVSLTGNPFDTSLIAALTSASSLDAVFAAFAPVASGGGAQLRAAGYPAYLDIGAAQHQDSGGGGGSGPTNFIISF